MGGKARGRRLTTLDGDATRPTQGKVREALFNILQAWVPGGAWLDLFAGSGAVGLEAASRGARRVVVVERARPALAVIAANVRATGLQVEVLPLEVEAAVTRLAGTPFDVVFLDPPYALDPLPLITRIDAAGLVAPTGRLVLEHDARREAPARLARLARLSTRRYAGTALSLYAPADAAGEAVAGAGKGSEGGSRAP
ncbi:MAG: 16S rRNA (guanine(966)-N(2))-methyltransferase RsmD [Candidatus Sericytochromatia bacterium]|nr:16S rRNA (guanine(966)-N(2))-methyltransferase RsmD [Candidatus Sericytochromatia bacterium]